MPALRRAPGARSSTRMLGGPGDGMSRTATLTMREVGARQDVTVAELSYQMDSVQFEAASKVWTIRQDVMSPSGLVRVESAWSAANSNLSLAVFIGGVHVLLVTCHWADVDPYFGARLSDGRWLHVFTRRD